MKTGTTVIIRMGATHYNVEVREDGETAHFDLSKMTRKERHKIRRLLVGVFEMSQQKGIA